MAFGGGGLGVDGGFSSGRAGWEVVDRKAKVHTRGVRIMGRVWVWEESLRRFRADIVLFYLFYFLLLI